MMHTTLKSAAIETPLGPMLAIVDDNALFLLEFHDCKGLAREINRLQIRTRLAIVQGETRIIQSIKHELNAYFSGTLKQFKTPLHILGTPFQQQAWQALMHIPYGNTRSYGQQAESIGKPKAYRAVANANGANQLAIVIPCHRIIQQDGSLGGYGGGVNRKKWLIDWESQHKD